MTDLSPPLAWELFDDKNQPRGDVTWKGGTSLEINAGENLRALLHQSLTPLLDSEDVGADLSAFLAQLRTTSQGACWTRPVDRAKVISTLRWIAAAAADGSAIADYGPNDARYKNNTFPSTIDPATMLAATTAGTLAWEPTAKTKGFKAGGLVGGKQTFVTIAWKDRKAVSMVVSSGLVDPPRMFEQSDGFFKRCDLSKLIQILEKTRPG